MAIHYIPIIPPVLTATVFTLATSEPAPCSLTPRQATKSPAMVGTRNCCLSSSLPNLMSAGVAISAWTPIAMGTAPHLMLPKHSIKYNQGPMMSSTVICKGWEKEKWQKETSPRKHDFFTNCLLFIETIKLQSEVQRTVRATVIYKTTLYF